MTVMSMIRSPIKHRSAWKGSDFKSKDDIAVELSSRNLAALDELMRKARDSGRDLYDLTRADFDHPDLNGTLAEVMDEVMLGRGIVLLRRLPVERYTVEEAGIIYWGIGTHFGTAVSQSVLGDRLGHVMDMTKDDPHARAYRNNFEGSIHTDMSNLLGMLSIKQAAKGGVSRYASVAAIHNEMLMARPELLEPLYRGFPRHRRNEAKAGEPVVTPENVPIFTFKNGLLGCRYTRTSLEAAAAAMGKPMPEDLREALDYLDMLSHRSDILFECMLEPGDMTFMNNKTMLHGRTAFRDGDDPKERRHLMRLWIDVPIGHPGVAETDEDAPGRGGIAKQDGKIPSFDYGKLGLAPRPTI